MMRLPRRFEAEIRAFAHGLEAGQGRDPVVVDRLELLLDKYLGTVAVDQRQAVEGPLRGFVGWLRDENGDRSQG